MSLAPGARLGSYKVLAPLGEGGMGAVYRARDTKLGRTVAIKVILDEFSSNEERVGRFEREAKMLAALHHPRIASLFGLEHADGQPLRNAVLSATVTNPLLTRVLLGQFVARTDAVTPARVTVLQRPLVLKGSTNALGDWLIAFLSPEAGLLSNDPAAYASFDRETLIVWGELDTTTPLAQGTRLDAVIPRSELVVLKGIGHMPQIEDPDGFNRALLGFLGRMNLGKAKRR